MYRIIKKNEWGQIIEMLKLRYYEKTTKFEKNLQLGLTKQLFLLNSVKFWQSNQVGYFFNFCGLLRKAEL